MAELMHRTNNLLAVVQAIARETGRKSPDPMEFLPAFSARLEGLGVSSSLLAREDWRGALLEDLLRAQVAPLAAADRFDVDGPAVLLSPRAVQNLGLAFHELATNALKYGALSVAAGKVSVSWEVREIGRARELHLVWREHGGPPVSPPTRMGFGRVVSEKLLASALQARVEIDYPAAGLEWSLVLPEGEFSLPA
jgi:two-component system CheB/CheR fusion protein